MKKNKRPNILFALADDCSHFGVYGHEWVHTPNIDNIAGNGVVFDNAFTCNPKCAPSRATILTGRYTWELEDACNHFCYFPNHLKLLPDLLESAGYFAGYTGKGWEPGDWKKSGLKRNPAGNEYNLYNIERIENTCIALCDYGRNFENFLDQKPEGTPFFFWYGGREPHRPYSFGEGLRANRTLSEITKVPPYWPDTEEIRIDMLDYAFETEYFDKQLGLMMDALKKRGELENTVIVVTADNGCAFPRVKGQMYEQDFHLPMVAQWLTAQTKGGRHISNLINFPDLAPTFLDLAGAPECNEMTGKSFADVFTADQDGMLNYERRYAFFGREKHDPGREGRPDQGDVGYPVRCIRDDRYLYVHNFAPERWPAGNPETLLPNCDYSPTKRKIMALKEEGNPYYWNLAFGKRPLHELYDIQADPECMNNLAYREDYTEVVKDMWEKLLRFLEKTNDPRLKDPDYFDRKPQVTDHFDCTWVAYLEGRWKPASFLTHKWKMPDDEK